MYFRIHIFLYLLVELNINILIKTVISVKYAQVLNTKSEFLHTLLEKQFSIFILNPPNKIVYQVQYSFCV
jgi:hypothetical protein